MKKWEKFALHWRKIMNKEQQELFDNIILNETQEKPLEQELAEDMMMLLASFSGKLYGSRSHKNKIIIEEKGGEDGSINTQNSDISDE